MKINTTRLVRLAGLSAIFLLAVACAGSGAAAPTPSQTSAEATPTAATADDSGLSAIEGAVTGTDGKPVAGIRIAIVSGTAPFPEMAPSTDEKGYYRLSSLQPGTYEVAVRDDQGEEAGLESAVVKGGEITRLDFSISVDAATDTQDTLPPKPVIRLRYSGQLHDGVQGSYCWPDFQNPDGSVVGICADKISWFELGKAIPVAAGVAVEIEAGVPAQALTAGFYELGSDTQVLFSELGAGLDVALPVDLPTGTYNVRITGRWADGDMAYEFRITVEGENPAPAAVLNGVLCLPATPLAVSAGDGWTISGTASVPEGFPGSLPEGATKMSTEFMLDAIETATYSQDRGSASIEHPSLKAQLTALGLDADGNVLSTDESSGSWTPASVGNMGPVLTLDWACHTENWLQTASDGAVTSVSERDLASGVTAVVFTSRQPFVIPAEGIDATMEINNGYDKATGRVVLQETRATGDLKGQPFNMEILQELVPAGR